MKTNIQRILHVTCGWRDALATALVVVGFSLPTWAQRAPVSIEWELADRAITLHEPVMLRLTIQNLAGAALATVNLGRNEKSGLLFSIVKPDGTTNEIPPLEIPGVSSLGTVSLAPGGRYTHEFTVDEWYPFDTPGEYRIQVRLRYPVTLESRPIDVESTAILSCRIAARDEKTLQRRCASLADRILASHDNEEAGQFATALSYVRDPIAVPYLRESLSTQLYLAHDIVVRALGGFTTTEAVEALIAVAHAPGPDRDLASGTLRTMAQRIEDPQLRERVQRVLESVPHR